MLAIELIEDRSCEGIWNIVIEGKAYVCNLWSLDCGKGIFIMWHLLVLKQVFRHTLTLRTVECDACDIYHHYLSEALFMRNARTM